MPMRFFHFESQAVLIFFSFLFWTIFTSTFYNKGKQTASRKFNVFFYYCYYFVDVNSHELFISNAYIFRPVNRYVLYLVIFGFERFYDVQPNALPALYDTQTIRPPTHFIATSAINVI